MMIYRTLFALLLATILASPLQAQSLLPLALRQQTEAYTPYVESFANPAFLRTQRLSLPELSQPDMLRAVYAHRTTAGLTQWDEGWRKSLADVGGQMWIDTSEGSFCGSASYARDTRHGAGYNLTLHPRDFYPYLVGDMSERPLTTLQTYSVSGTWSMRPSTSLAHGVEVGYRGTLLSSVSEPRIENYTAITRVKYGLLLSPSQRDHFGISLSGVMQRQSLAGSDYKGTSDTYYFHYGMGEWSRSETVNAYFYKRLLRRYSGSLALSYMRPSRIFIGLEGEYHYAETEEMSGKKLYGYHAPSLETMVWCRLWRRGPRMLFLQVRNDLEVRFGRENIYHYRPQVEDQPLYDYDLVGQDRLYRSLESRTELLLGYHLLLAKRRELSLSLSGEHRYGGEVYLFPKSDLREQTMGLKVAGEGISRIGDRHTLSLSASLLARQPIEVSARGTNTTSEIYPLLIETPMKIRTAPMEQVFTSLSYSYTLGSGRTCGLALSAAYRHLHERAHIGTVLGRQTDLSIRLFYLF